MTLVFTKAAQTETEAAGAWYEAQRPRLGMEFLAALDAAIETVRTHPEAYPVVLRDIRRARLHRFPYSLFYRVHDKQLLVIACFHARRDPRAWQRR